MTFDLIAAAGAGAAQTQVPWYIQSQLPLIIGFVLIFWFVVFWPQMKQQKEHRAKVAAMKKGDQVVTAGGLVGKVVKVDDVYVELELGTNVRVKAIKATIGDIIPPGGTPAND
jgi:preprotein translocase subunit YajC